MQWRWWGFDVAYGEPLGMWAQDVAGGVSEQRCQPSISAPSSNDLNNAVRQGRWSLTTWVKQGVAPEAPVTASVHVFTISRWRTHEMVRGV